MHNKKVSQFGKRKKNQREEEKIVAFMTAVWKCFLLYYYFPTILFNFLHPICTIYFHERNPLQNVTPRVRFVTLKERELINSVTFLRANNNPSSFLKSLLLFEITVLPYKKIETAARD